MRPQDEQLIYHSAIEQTAREVVLGSLPMTKQGLQELAVAVLETVVDGNASALATYARLHAMESVCDQAKKLIAPFVKSKLGDKDSYELATFSTRGNGWDFDNCNDPVLLDLQKQAAELSAKIKKRKEYLVKLAENNGIDTDGAQVDTVLPTPKDRVIICSFQDEKQWE